jgi:hypothetical protein
MVEVELDAIRKLLQGALKNLGEGAADINSAPIAVVSGSSDLTDASGTPMIVVVASDSALPREPRTSNQSQEPLNRITPECGCNERKVSHPGFERFTIDRGTQISAPKSCFMEPDRLCVNSGACEMRGF